jgi:pimeloyl-ACP methyl ester carboxylesterase
MMQPETQFATVGNDRVAYQVLGNGPRDVVYTSGFWSHLDIEWEDPGMARFFRRLASFSRLIRFDRRGTGLSDRPSEVSSSEVERWLQDCAAVLDAVGSTAATSACFPLMSVPWRCSSWTGIPIAARGSSSRTPRHAGG